MTNSGVLSDFAEVDRYAEAVNAYRTGSMDGDRFMAFRLQHGIYGQRQDGVHMVRVKIPGGRLNTKQLAVLAGVLEDYSQEPVACVTTRQDIQFHFVRLDDTPQLMRRLAEVDLTTREACGNTVRNVTACPLSGICPKEHTNISTFVDATVQRFLRNPLTQHLPRKFKMSFSGCETDCAMGLMHDVGVVAIRRNGEFGFKILAAGGLGHKPHEAIVVEEFIDESGLLPSIEALISLHNRYSDRKKRAKARIKFLVDKFGVEGFLEKYREEVGRTRAATSSAPSPRGEWRNAQPGPLLGPGAPRSIVSQRQPNLYVVPISLPTGDIRANEMRGLVAVMARHGLDDIRATQDQNLMLVNVPGNALDQVRQELAAAGLRLPHSGDNIVSCPGTTTCRLGITASKLVAPKLSGGPSDLAIRVSGCHNSCGQHHVGDIGIHGEGKRMHGKLIPCYATHFGGSGIAGGAIAMKGPVIPALRITDAVTRVQEAFAAERRPEESFFQWSRQRGEAFFNELLADLSKVEQWEVNDLSRDHGDKDSFRVLQLGGGECAGATQDYVAANFSEAMHERTYRNGFSLQRKFVEAAECALQMQRLAIQSLVFLAGHKADSDYANLVAQLRDSLGSDTQLVDQAEQLANALGAVDGNYADADGFAAISNELDSWIAKIADRCQRLDGQVDLTTSLASLTTKAPQPHKARTIDLSDYSCPLHYVKARNELKSLPAGEVLEFVLASGEPANQVTASLEKDGHEIIGSEFNGPHTRITVRKPVVIAQASGGL